MKDRKGNGCCVETTVQKADAGGLKFS